LRIDLSKPGLLEPVIPELSIEMWPHWLEIAIQHMRQAKEAHTRLLGARDAGDNVGIDQGLNDELRSSMQAICAVAFAVDAFYASLTAHMPIDPRLRASWREKRTSRDSIILEVLRVPSVLSRPQVASLKRVLGSIYQFRDWAVHPPADFRAAILHPDLQVGVDQRYLQFQSSNAERALSAGFEVFLRVLDNPRDLPGHQEWCKSHRAILDDVLTTNKVVWSWNAQEGDGSESATNDEGR
jgi:hypothetical protein